jgi:Bacterial aa3 type cytochrome c oxidase subunit IV
MARKPTQTQTITPAMDYKAHETTYRGFLTFVKWAIVGLAVLVVALYFIIRP